MLSTRIDHANLTSDLRFGSLSVSALSALYCNAVRTSGWVLGWENDATFCARWLQDFIKSSAVIQFPDKERIAALFMRPEICRLPYSRIKVTAAGITACCRCCLWPQIRFWQSVWFVSARYVCHDDNGYLTPFFYIISCFDTLSPIFTNSDTDNSTCTTF